MPKQHTHSASQIGPNGPRCLVGDEARALIETQLAAHSGGILSTLSRYRLDSAVQSLHETIRAIEEFINIPLFALEDKSARQRLLSTSIDNMLVTNPVPTFAKIRQILAPCVEESVAQRYLRTLLQISAIRQAFRIHGQVTFGTEVGLDSIGAAVRYFQSRRRHLVSLLYSMPAMCSGREELAVLDALNVFLPQVEHSCISITGFHHKLALLDALDDFNLEPERASIMAMIELRADQIIFPTLEPIDQMKIFSATELRNNVKILRAAYDTFSLEDSDFSAIAQLVIAFSRHCQDDYFVELSKSQFEAILQAQTRFNPVELKRMLVNAPSDYATNTNAYEPFITVGDSVVSNVNLLSRFLYFFKNLHLESRRRFQIHGGFIFEDMVQRELQDLGFHITDIKRINRKEFDVVTTHNGVIHNFQCKNNFIDIAKITAQRKLFVRYNRSLVRYYRGALTKERKREHLLKQALGLDHVEHYVISRFPVICTDDRIINYNRIDQLRNIVGATT